jgi:hypothetical protein
MPPSSTFGRSFLNFGKQIIGWGHGAKEARQRIATITLEELKQGCVTKAQAQAAKDFYVGVNARNPGNAAARERIALMNRVIELLGEE